MVAPLTGQWQLGQPPLPVSLQSSWGEGRCAFRGGEGPPHVGGPTGEGAQGQVLGSSRHRQKPSSAAWALDWLGVKGEDKEAALSLSQERASGRRGRGLTQPDSRGAHSSVSICPGIGGQEAQGREASVCGAKNRGAEALPLPEPESPDHSIGRAQEEGQGHSCLPGAGQGPSCRPGTKRKPPCPRRAPAHWSARPSWVFGRLGNSSKC